MEIEFFRNEKASNFADIINQKLALNKVLDERKGKRN
jgi:hypothetical protein